MSELFKRVDSVFAGGDVAEMAALLARMRASLALVGHVPEFAGGLQRLSVRILLHTAVHTYVESDPLAC